MWAGFLKNQTRPAQRKAILEAIFDPTQTQPGRRVVSDNVADVLGLVAF